MGRARARRAGAWSGILLAGALGASSCADDAPPAPSPLPSTVELTGEARLDGEPLDAPFLGAAVIDGGLVTPCQAAIPPVERGRFRIPVHSSRGGFGCGQPGTQVVLWTSAGGTTLWSTEAVAWPDDGAAEVDVDLAFRAADPDGAAPEVAQFHGTVFEADGDVAPVGTRVEAFVGEVRCGMASVRRSDSFVGYVVSIVGPASVAGCTRDAPIQLRVAGAATDHDAIVNAPPGKRDPVDLRRRR